MSSISYGYNPRKPYAVLMRGRPDESDSWQSIAVYTLDEFHEYLAKGWKKDRVFMEMADRARRRDN